MLKIKLFAVAGVLSLMAIVLCCSPVLVSKAESDTILQQIAGYKNWQRINKEPIKVANTLIIDETAVTNIRISDVGG
jgi:hypothetical protein